MNPGTSESRESEYELAVPMVGSENRLWHGGTHMDHDGPARSVSI